MLSMIMRVKPSINIESALKVIFKQSTDMWKLNQSTLTKFISFHHFKVYISCLQVIVIEDELSQVACPITTKLVLDQDPVTKEPLVQVHKNLVTRLKPHQVDGKSSPPPCEWRLYKQMTLMRLSWSSTSFKFLHVCVCIVYNRSPVYLGQLLWVCQDGQLLPGLGLHPGSLHGPGQDPAGWHWCIPELLLIILRWSWFIYLSNINRWWPSSTRCCCQRTWSSTLLWLFVPSILSSTGSMSSINGRATWGRTESKYEHHLGLSQ